MKLLWLGVLSLTLFSGSLGLIENQLLDNIVNFPSDYNEYWASGEVSERLAQTFNLLKLKTKWKGPTRSKADPPLFDLLPPASKAPITCLLCETMVNSIFGWVDAGDTKEEIVDKVVDLCLTFNIQTEKVCRGVVDMNADIFLFIYANREVRAVDVCGMGLFPDCPLDNPMFDWSIDVSAAGPKPPAQNPELPSPGSPTFKVLHISDFHLDIYYAPGSNADCGEPTCCRADQGPPLNQSGAAGYWGDYRDCDMPWHSYVNMLEHIRETHPDISYILYTGDTPDHTVWFTSIEHNTEVFTRSYNEIARVFDGVTVFPILGNHEPHPLNLFVEPNPNVPANVSSDWLYTLSKDIWSQWLDPETHADILRGGFYATRVFDKLWMVAVNNNFCYNYNFWSLYDNEDPADQLKWLVETLKQIEDLGEKVHLLAHIPSGNANCVNSWMTEFNKILNRFSDTVTAQFNGHSHHDEFFIYYDLEDRSRANGVSFIPGSTSEWNPYYRIYTVEGTSDNSFYRILDHENWYYNLTEANLAGEAVPPNWQKLYSFNEEYGTKAVTPFELDILVHRMANDTSLKEKYFRYYYSMSDPKLEQGCDETCQNKLLCKIVETQQGDKFKCDELLPSNKQ